ncbi:hypothetical protein VTK73DRAFT_1385 [Phialemonium thermophilum]|uniref:EKC/KEOPS complex subunit BUD32 n=1 Tax=Phialemonium thermophilum TaxID=223376 RepID=A0ABR3VTI1_9PEZI
MPNGSVDRYLRDHAPGDSLRLKWARQAAEGLAYAHSRGVLHCDVSVGNFLLDANLDLKLGDFQGRLLNDDGSIWTAGQRRAPCRRCRGRTQTTAIARRTCSPWARPSTSCLRARRPSQSSIPSTTKRRFRGGSRPTSFLPYKESAVAVSCESAGEESTSRRPRSWKIWRC